jgi:hypothetical protein
MTAYGSRNALADKPTKLTDRQAQALESMRVNSAPINPRVLSELRSKGLVFWADNATNTGASWEITDRGRAALLAASDKTSSASRQHHIDTGRYLKYRDRPEFQRHAFKVGEVVRRIDRPGSWRFEIVALRGTVALGNDWYDVKHVAGDQQVHELCKVSPEFYEVVQEG